MEANEFRIWWQAEFGECPPVGYHLRETFPTRWVRFHSLPYGQRYANTHDEAAEIVRRHNAVASALLGNGEPIVVVCTGYSDSEKPVPPENHHALPAWLQLAHADTMAVDDDPPSYWHFWTAPTRWLPGRFDELLSVSPEIRRNRWVDPTWCLGNLAETMRRCADGTQQSNDKN